MEDIEIARNAKLEKIGTIAEKIGINAEELEYYGKYKAKIPDSVLKSVEKNKDGKLILVTAINPTPLGEGKTTMSIGLADAMNAIGKKTVLALREPSLGPVFGIKGGATGGGYSQIAPMEDINLHFTGDIHAITAANNLISAMIDNHIYHGNELKIKNVVWKRCLDISDRQLRKVETGLSGEKNVVSRMDGFDISVAQEIRWSQARQLSGDDPPHSCHHQSRLSTYLLFRSRPLRPKHSALVQRAAGTRTIRSSERRGEGSRQRPHANL